MPAPLPTATCRADSRRFFADNTGLEAVPAYDTAGSVRELMGGTLPADAVIASSLAARLYGARVQRAELEDDPANFTRFVLVAREPAVLAGPSKLSLTFMLPNEPGALHRALGAFAGRDLNLTKIESCPLPGRPWEYVFYVDVAGDPAEQVQAALAELRGLTKELRVLGWFPAGNA